MKKIIPLFFVTSVLFGNNALADDNNNDRSVKFILNANPAAFAIMPNLEDFTVDNGSVFETIEGTTTWTPNVNAGISIKISDPVSLEATIGAGKLISDAIDASFTTQRIGLNFKVAPIVTLGIQGGNISYTNLEWEGINDDVEFDDADGSLIGLSLTVGTELISFYGSVERMDVDDVEVAAPAGSVATSSILDISGTMINLGAKLKF